MDIGNKPQEININDQFNIWGNKNLNQRKKKKLNKITCLLIKLPNTDMHTCTYTEYRMLLRIHEKTFLHLQTEEAFLEVNLIDYQNH